MIFQNLTQTRTSITKTTKQMIRFFKPIALFASLAVAVTACHNATSSVSYTSFVDPYIGTDAHGHVFLGANVPFGGVQLGPSNLMQGWDWASGYHYSDSIVKGFAHTHLSGTGIGDLGDIVMLPVTGDVPVAMNSKAGLDSTYLSKYRHENESVRPGYYSVLLERYGIKAELTATERCGFHRYTYPDTTDNARLIIDLESGIGWDAPTEGYFSLKDDRTIVGYRYSTGWAVNQRIYFTAHFSEPVVSMSCYDGLDTVGGNEVKGVKMRAFVDFGKIKNLEVKVGISAVDIEGAERNYQAELLDSNFDEVTKDADAKWNAYLSKIDVESGNNGDKRAFYTALYHTAFAPQLFNDVNGDYRGADGKIYSDTTSNTYTIYSLWDTYRAANPLYSIIEPQRLGEFVNDFVKIYEQQGRVPVWHLVGNENDCMVGYHSIPVMAMAYLRGIGGFDAQKAYEAAKAYASLDERGLGYVRTLGYIPADKEIESVAKALEYAIDDWAIAQMALKMGNKEDYDYFMNRSKNYTHYFDKESGFMRGKRLDGTWTPDFDPVKSRHRDDDYCEGNAWQYLWLVPHDVEGLVALFGSEEAFENKLDSLFTIEAVYDEESSPDISGLIGQYAQGNEPNHSTPFLYNYIGRQWKSAAMARRIMREFFTDAPDGLCGNEDAGQMSAWYVLTAMGFYPANATNGAFLLASPLFDKASINVGEGKRFTIEAENNSDKNIYIQSATLNGKPYTKSYITYSDIMNGGTLHLVMGETPNKDFGSSAEDRPQSKVY